MNTLHDTRLHLLESLEEVEAFFGFLGRPRPLLGVDIETTGLSLARDRIRLVQFGDEHEAWAIPWDEWRGVIRRAFAVYDRPIVLQHAKFDAGFLQREGIPFPWDRTHDTKVMLFLHDSLGPQGLKPAAALHVDPAARAGEKEMKAAMLKHRWGYDTIPIDFAPYWGYACIDTILTVRLALKLWPQVQYARAAYDLEMACQRVLCDMEMRGVRLDVPYVRDQREGLASELGELLHGLEADGVNPSSPATIVAALQARGIELTKRTASGGAFAVDDDVLSALDDQVARDVLRARYAQKMLSAYFDTFLKYEADGRLYPHMNQLQARTGRMSVTDPALQTLPRTSSVRDAIIPGDDNLLVLADYDTQELRVAAHYAGDPVMIAALTSGQDMHMDAARRVFGPNAGKPERSKMKNGLYARTYGAGAPKLAETLGIPVVEARELAEAIGREYPAIDRTMMRVTEAVRRRADEDGRETGYVSLIDGRRLRVKKDKAYVGLNALIQGSCAVVLKQALVNLDAAGLGHTLALPVHDEVVFDVPRDEVDDALPVIRECMERDDLRVPLTVGTKVVERWGDAYRTEDA